MPAQGQISCSLVAVSTGHGGSHTTGGWATHGTGGRRAVHGAAGNCPLQGWAYENGGVVHTATVAVGAGTVDLIAVILVVGDPVNVIEGAIIVFHGVVVIVPELLEAFFLGGKTLVALGENIPPRLISAVTKLCPARLGGRSAACH